ncbi:alanyl-tRNA editing protein [Pararhodobacter oceanensis]|uniref:Alanine--tRNA ligase n=1 Tax=Pararhodobacter oceanensis TaxID=2172121 RepID=A0A2T8HYT4_9RHOB|nr:alanyl-tRNA editing protein [Pararhodobacter oceanensis]PVH30597.1 Ala-tRNA(Pro) hydrolase [Pararhodobacter oceanensis]
MTQPAYQSDAYAQSCTTTVTRHSEIGGDSGGVVVAASVFYPSGGGQPGDSGRLTWDGGAAEVTDTRKDGDDIALILAAGADLPPVGAAVTMTLDWSRRHRHMRIHTALHLLSVVIPLPVTGGAITAEKGRLDFDMVDAPEDKQQIEDALNALVARDLAISESWITDAELAANPGLVKTMSVRPPTGQGRVRLVRIGSETEQIDLQPCGGTHVRSTGEIGRLRLGKIEKKGKQNRRVSIHFAD